MIDTGTFYVITVGRRYACTDDGIVGNHLEHALRFYEREEALAACDKLRKLVARSDMKSRSVEVQRVAIAKVS